MLFRSELAAISLANQPQFVLTLFYMGITSGTAIMIAQYLGAKDKAAVNFIFQLSLLFMVGVSFVFTVLTSLVPEVIISIFTTDVTLIALGKEYLQIVGISYVMTAFSQIYLVLLKTMQKVKKSAIISIITLVLNVVLNAIFISGLIGMPKLGCVGLAIATVIAIIIEFCIFVLDSKRIRYIFLRRE